MISVHQFTAGFTNGDAISNEARFIKKIFQSWGYPSEIFSEAKRILPQLRKEALDTSELAASCRPDDVVLLHLSMGTPVNDAFLELPCRKAILYHNITPSHYFDIINKSTACSLEHGREQLKKLAGSAEVNMAVSKYNASELEEAGYKDVKVLPLLIDFSKLHEKPDRTILKRFNDGSINILFVGRCSPNKRIEDLVDAFYYFHEFVQPASRLIHAGSWAGTERYYHLLQARVQELGLNNIRWAGSVPQNQLNAFYQLADVFLCMSEHEGFCIPLLEAMTHDVPVMAFSAAAVPETMDGSGIVFKEKNYELIAEMINKVTTDPTFRKNILAGQKERLSRFKSLNLETDLRKHLTPLLDN